MVSLASHTLLVLRSLLFFLLESLLMLLAVLLTF